MNVLLVRSSRCASRPLARTRGGHTKCSSSTSSPRTSLSAPLLARRMAARPRPLARDMADAEISVWLLIVPCD